MGLTTSVKKRGKREIIVLDMNEENKAEKIKEVIKKLYEYESTGLKPSQVKRLSESQNDIGCKWCQSYKNIRFVVCNKDGVMLRTAGYVYAGGKCKFCPSCGKKII